MLVKNHMSRPLILQEKSGLGGLVVNPVQAMKLGRVVIPPGQAKDIPFWDAIKGHDYYVRKLDRGDITIGNDGANRGVDTDFSTFGDTLKPPPNLDQNNVNREVSGDPSLEAVDLEKSLENAPQVRRRGRKPKNPQSVQPESVADLVSDIAE